MYDAIQIDSESLYVRSWLERIFFASQRRSSSRNRTNQNGISTLDKQQQQQTTPPISSSASESLEAMLDEPSTSFLWFWSLWECAQYCVQAKLKTPLGKANETFGSFETAIRTFARGDPNIPDDSASQHTRLTLLVHFVEYLEKLVYNAYEGTAVCLQPAAKLVKLFFRTNKSTCNEWYKLYILSSSFFS